MQIVQKKPVKVDIQIERSQPLSSGFYRVGFITNSVVATEMIVVRTLKDLLDAGFNRTDLAYNFCLSVFAQNRMTEVVIYPKYPAETYEKTATKFDLSQSYFLVIESKNIEDIVRFSDFLENSKYRNLLFFSHYNDYSEQVADRKIVYYFDEYFSDVDGDYVNNEGIPYYFYQKAYGLPLSYQPDYVYSWLWDEGERVTWDSYGRVAIGVADFSTGDAQSGYAAYPEASWIAYCGVMFPSQIQWAYKPLIGVRSTKLNTIPNLATTTAKHMFKTNVTTNFAALANNVKIEHQVSLDWLTSAIEYNMWQALYKAETKITIQRYGVDVLEGKLREVLEVAVNTGIFTDYQITERSFDSRNYKASYKFTATLQHSILGVDKVEGSIYN